MANVECLWFAYEFSAKSNVGPIHCHIIKRKVGPAMIHPSSGYTSWSKEGKDESCHTGMGTAYGSTRHATTLSRQRSHVPQAVIHLSRNMLKKNEFAETTAYVGKRNRIHCSGPLMPPGGNMDEMLKNTKDKFKRLSGKHVWTSPGAKRTEQFFRFYFYLEHYNATQKGGEIMKL